MSDETPTPAPARKQLSPAAERALAEAQARREAEDARREAEKARGAAPEIGGRDGPEPTRYGDWEKAGIISDF